MDLEGVLTKFKIDDGDVEPVKQYAPADTTVEHVQQIQNFFSNNLDVSKLDYYLGLTFPESENEGLLRFLKIMITHKPYDKAKEQVLNLIQFILNQRSWKSDVARFCFRFKKIVDMYWSKKSEGARLQQAALDVLICLFENFGTIIDLDEFDNTQLYLELLKKSEMSAYQPTVRGKMLHLIGITSSLGHESFMNRDGYFTQLFGHITSTLKSQVESTDTHLEVSILLGCLKAMDKILYVYKNRIQPTNPSWIQFQDHLEQIVDPSCSIIKGHGKAKIKRREFQRAALELVANHSASIRAGLLRKYKQWYEDLLVWSKSSNLDDNKIGRKAMNRFLETVIEHTKELNDDLEEDAKNFVQGVFQFFAEKFKSVLTFQFSNKIELGIAIRGFGILSCLSADNNQALEMLNLIMQQIETIVQELESSVVDKYSGSLSVLPIYLESVASIIPSIPTENNVSKIPDKYLDLTIRLAVLLIKYYPDLGDNQRNFCHISIQKVFDAVWTFHHVQCESFIEQIYNKSLLQIVSGPTRAEIDILIESWNKTHPDSKKSPISQLGLKPVFSYVKFWKLLLSHGPGSSSSTTRFDKLMQWILTTIGKLDLTISFDDREPSDSMSDPIQGATPNVAMDFQIFVNIVDFLHELMTETSLQQKFETWISAYTLEILAYIKTHGMVSGFYKILAVVFDSARCVNYFEKKEQDVQELKNKLNIFFRNLGTKIREFQDDLLFAVLELWLSLPDDLILTNFTALNHTLITIFSVGRNSYPLAIRGLEAIDRWFVQPKFPVEELQAIMNNIFPLLKTYFIESASNQNKISEGVNNVKMKDLIKKKIQTVSLVDDPTLKSVQLKILQLIGAFGQFINLADKKHSGLSKDQRCLLYEVPFQDTKPELHLDDLLPRVLELCENAPERQTRVSACEFFHTVFLVFIEKSTKTPKYDLFRQLFQSILKLGCDFDIVVRQLFNPLCLQTIHWFSKKESPYGELLVEILTERIIQRENSSLRELAALCIGEYFAWSLKHQSSQVPNSKARNVLKNILAMSTHASLDFRQGSVLAFNSIYKDFREESTLVNDFSFSLLYSFLTCLQLSKDLPDDSLLVTNTKQSIKHLERIIIKKKSYFNTALKRQFLPGSNAKENPLLQDVVDWSIRQGGSVARTFREECLRITSVFAPLIKNVSSIDNYLSSYEDKMGSETWIQIAEASFSFEASTEQNLLFLEASSDFYSFLFIHKMLKKYLFTESGRSFFCTTLLKLSTQPKESLNAEETLMILKIYSKLTFVWELFGVEQLDNMWKYSLQLSLGKTDFLLDLVQTWTFRLPSDNMKQICKSLCMFEPEELLQNTNHIAAINQALWYRHVAQGGLMENLLDSVDLQLMAKTLWTNITTTLFKSVHSSDAGVSWEASNLRSNQKTILNNFLITALHIGLDKVMVVDEVFDATNVTHKDGSFQLISTKGQIFQKHLLSAIVYCDSLFEFDTLMQQRPIKDVGEFIQRILDLLKTDKTLRQKFGPIVHEKSLKNWKMISNNCDSSTCVKMFAGLLTINMEACKNSEELSNWFNGPNLLQARHLDLKQKAEVFGYSAVFAESRKLNITEELVNTISNLIENDFKCDDIPWADVEQYVTHIFRRILKLFERLNTTWTLIKPLLRMVDKLSTWIKDSTPHVVFLEVKTLMEKTIKFVYVTESDRVSLASRTYTLVTSDAYKTFIESDNVWKFCLLPIVSSLTAGATTTFFKRHVWEIITHAEVQSTSVYDWKLKTLSVHLFELLFYQTNPEFIKSNELAKSYFEKLPDDKKQKIEGKTDEEKLKFVNLNQSVCRVCLSMSTSVTFPEDINLRNCIFRCHEACYNAIVAILVVTKKEFKFFEKFLFPGKRLFENLIDSGPVYKFPLVLDESRHKTGVISYRKAQTNYNVEDVGRALVSMNSSNLSGSSLAPEATSYDFTTSVTVANSEYYQRIFGNKNLAGNASAGDKDVANDESLEWSEVNQHECMFAFVKALKQMGEFARLKEDTDRKWQKTLESLLEGQTIHNNIKVFIVGGILNTPECLQPFAPVLIDPIIRLILNDSFGSIKLNHFVQDIIITLLSWNKTGVPNKANVTAVLNYILDSVKTDEFRERNDIFRHAMTILQNVVKYWVSDSDITVIPFDNIMSFKNSDNSPEIFYLITLNVLLGGQVPHIDVQKLKKLFVEGISSNRFKGVYSTAAQCMGALLKQTPERYLQAYIDSIFNKLENMAKSKAYNLVEILSGIQKHFPGILTRSKGLVLELCQRPKIRPDVIPLLPMLLSQELREVSLNESTMFTHSQTRADEFFIEIDARNVFQQPCKTESEVEAALDLMELLVQHIAQQAKLLKLIDWVKCAETASASKMRARYANLLFRLFQKLSHDSQDVKLTSSTKISFMKIFVKMYDDEAEEVQVEVQEFWSHVLCGYRQTSYLLLEVFDLIGAEESPLHVCLGLILQRCIASPDYPKYIFKEPLENCEFYPQELDTSWRLRHASFQPLFAESLSTAQNFSALPMVMQSSLLSQRRSVGKFGMNVLRATLANLQFTPTQQDEDDSLDGGMHVESFGNFGVTDLDLSRNADLKSTPNSAINTNPILQLRKRFYERKDSGFYAYKMLEKQTKRLEDFKEKEKSRVAGVKTVRKYRIGELPDIMIKHSDLLNTLLKLAKRDVTFGQGFVVQLFMGIRKETEASNESRKFLSKTTEVFSRVLHNATSHPNHSLSALLVEVSVRNNIPIQPSIIVDICKLTNLQKLGILKLEDELLNSIEISYSKKPRIKSISYTEKLWLGVAEMYMEIEEYDMLGNIFNQVHDAATDDDSKAAYKKIWDALHNERQGNLHDALSMFDEILDAERNESNDGNTTSKIFLEDAIVHCLTTLGDWSTLYDISGDLNTVVTENTLHDTNNVIRLLPTQIMSGMQLLLREENDEQEQMNTHAKFNAFMLNSLSTEVGTGFLRNTYPFDVGVWLLIEDEENYFSMANLMVEHGFDTVLNKMRNLDSSPLKVQHQVIISLQQSSILNDYLKWRKHPNELRVLEEPTVKVIEKWNKCLSGHPTPLLGSDLVSAHRDYFASKMGLTLENLGSTDQLLLNVQKYRVKQELWLANQGIFHKNHVLSHNCLRRIKSSRLENIEPTEYRQCMAKYVAKFHSVLQRDDWAKRWCSVWKKLDSNARAVYDIKADLLLCMINMMAGETEFETGSSSQISKALAGNTSESLSTCLLKAVREVIEIEHTNDLSHTCGLYLKLFELLKKLSGIFPDVYGANDDIATKMLRCLLRGCAGGRPHDMLQFSNVFLMLKQFPTLIPRFEEMTENVPTYLFLPWIDQIMTTWQSDLQQYAPLENIVKRIQSDFPNAMQLQYPEYLDENHQLFVSALQAIVLPHKLHEKIVSSIGSCQNDKKCMKLLIKFQASLRTIVNNSKKVYGVYHTDYALELFPIVSNTVDKFQESDTSLNSESVMSDSDELSKSIQSCKTKIEGVQKACSESMKAVVKKASIELIKFSPFLAEFHFYENDSFEKPGLYMNFCRPRTEDHPVIVSFHPTVQILNSLTQPIKLTAITNDGKKTNFLAKLGDDLRQDRRIMQLLKISNELFRADSISRRRNVIIETFSCIPITADYGIIEMIDDVVPLSEMIFYVDGTKDYKVVRRKAIAEYSKWIFTHGGNGNGNQGVSRCYSVCGQNVSREVAVEFHNEMSKQFPKFLLRDHITNRTITLREYFSIRQDIITAYAAMCMAHWLLGIGDRHLDNCLVSMKSGKLIGIDYGRAFGTSNSILPVPEMIPFRLTAQLQALMLPHSYTGLFKETCLSAWKCLTDATSIILTVADVFVKEPNIDWLKVRNRSIAGAELKNLETEAFETSKDKDKWIPMEIMKKKMAGHNPLHLLLEELKVNTSHDIGRIYSRIVEDGKLYKEKVNVSDEEYIDILLDLATDKNVLSRIYVGWNSFV